MGRTAYFRGPVFLVRDAADRDSPGLAGFEQRIRVELVCPAEEVGARIRLGRPVDGSAKRRRPARAERLPSLEGVQTRLRLLGDGPFLVAAWHRAHCTSIDSACVSAALAVRGLAKRYGNVTALGGVDLEVAEGELVGLLGPNGAGKSTLVKIACGLVRQTAGSAAVCGAPAGSIGARRQIGYLAELFRFPGWMSADEVLTLHQRLSGSSGGERERTELLELVALREARERRVEEMSKGMQQRLGVAQALVGAPRLLLLDEPTSALDPVGRRTVRMLLEELRARGISVLLNSHLLSEIELVCDRVVILLGGRVTAAGTPDELSRARGIELETDAGTRLVAGTRDDVPRVVGDAIAAGERIYGVNVRRSTLEDVYLEAVGGETD